MDAMIDLKNVNILNHPCPTGQERAEEIYHNSQTQEMSGTKSWGISL